MIIPKGVRCLLGVQKGSVSKRIYSSSYLYACVFIDLFLIFPSSSSFIRFNSVGQEHIVLNMFL